MMEVFVDSMPLNGSTYVVSLHNKTDNTLTVIGCDNPQELSCYGVNDLRDYYVGVNYEVCDDEGTTYEIMRLV